MEENILGKRIKQLRVEHNLSQLDLSKKLNISNSTLSQYEAGNRTPNDDIKMRIASLFEVSIDYLLGNSSERNISVNMQNKDFGKLSKREKQDIAKDLEHIRQELLSADDLMFDGHPMSDESIENILAALEIGMEQVRRKNKSKYTPNKYRRS